MFSSGSPTQLRGITSKQASTNRFNRPTKETKRGVDPTGEPAKWIETDFIQNIQKSYNIIDVFWNVTPCLNIPDDSNPHSQCAVASQNVLSCLTMPLF
jgi:hypothetical protein